MSNPDRPLFSTHSLDVAITTGETDRLFEKPQRERTGQEVSDSWRDRVATPETEARIQRARKIAGLRMGSLGIPRADVPAKRPKS